MPYNVGTRSSTAPVRLLNFYECLMALSVFSALVVNLFTGL